MKPGLRPNKTIHRVVKIVSHLMEKDQLISMIHFLEKRDEENKKENEALKDLLKSLREEYREDAEQTQKLLKTIEVLTKQVSDITAENRKLRQKVNDLLSKIIS